MADDDKFESVKSLHGIGLSRQTSPHLQQSFHRQDSNYLKRGESKLEPGDGQLKPDGSVHRHGSSHHRHGSSHHKHGSSHHKHDSSHHEHKGKHHQRASSHQGRGEKQHKAHNGQGKHEAMSLQHISSQHNTGEDANSALMNSNSKHLVASAQRLQPPSYTVTDKAKEQYEQVVEEFSSKHGIVKPEKQIVVHGSRQPSLKVLTAGRMERGEYKDQSTQYSEEDLMAETHYILACCSFLCCPIFSLASLISSCKVSKYRKKHDMPLANSYSRRALCCGISGILLGVVVYIILGYLFMTILGAVWWLP